MGKWTGFTDEEKKIAAKMRKEGKRIKEIADFLSKPVNVIDGYLKRAKILEKNKVKKVDKFKNITPADHKKMMDCYITGMTDKDSASECYVSRSTYAQWRLSQGLLPNKTTYMKIKHKSYVTQSKNCLKPDDVAKYYKHNEYNVELTNQINHCRVIIDKEEAERQVAILGITNRKTEKPSVFTLNGRILGNQQGKTVFEASFGGRSI